MSQLCIITLVTSLRPSFLKYYNCDISASILIETLHLKGFCNVIFCNIANVTFKEISEMSQLINARAYHIIAKSSRTALRSTDRVIDAYNLVNADLR